MCVCVCSVMSYNCRRLNALQFPWVPLAHWAGGLEGRIEPSVEYLIAFFGGGVHSSNGYNVQVIDWPVVLGILHRITGARIDAQEFVGKDGHPNTRFAGHQSLYLYFIFTMLGVTLSSVDFFIETIVLVSAKILDLDTL